MAINIKQVAAVDALAKAAAVVQKHFNELVEKSAEEVAAEELIDLQLKLDAVDAATISKRQAELKKELQLIAKDKGIADDTAWAIQVPAGAVELSKCANAKELIKPKELLALLRKKVGDEAAFSCMSFNLTELGKMLSGNELEAFFESKTGSRTCKIKPKTVA